MTNDSTVSTVIAVVAILFLFSLMGYCYIKAACARRSASDLNTRGETSVWTLPPAYSDLSQHLPPSYSQACRIIGYTKSEDNIIDGETNPSFEIQSDDTQSFSSLSTNNLINFPDVQENQQEDL